MRATVRSGIVAMVAAAAAGIVPAVASAQAPAARVMLYEVSESLKLTGGRLPQTPGGRTYDRDGEREEREVQRQATSLARLANASLLGDHVEASDPSNVFAAAQYMTSVAVSNVSLDPRSRTFGTGPITGNFDLSVFQDLSGTGQKILSNLVIINSGSLRGTLDLRAALTQAQPFAPVSGRWSLLDPRGGGGNFSGLFLIPFQLPPAYAKSLVPYLGKDLAGVDLYLNPTEQLGDGICVSGRTHDLTMLGIGKVCELSHEEHVLGFPLTKAVIFLFTGR